jgi:sugar/nucleoside kinase (ribokinase family)
VARPDLLCAGEAFEDLVFFGLPRVPEPGEELKTSSFLRTVGGGALITAVAAARLGTRARVLSGLGEAGVAALRADGVSVRNLKRPGEGHAVTVAISTRRDRSFVTYNGVNDVLEPRLRRALARERARHVHLAFMPPDCARWARILAGLRRRDVTTSWDFGWNEPLVRDPALPRLLAVLDYVFVNEKEVLLYSGKTRLAEALAHWRGAARNTIVKLGPRGARWVKAGGELRARPPRVKAVDTTGAGDAFNGGFLHALLRGRSPAACLAEGNRVGALSTTAAGGTTALPRARSPR